MAGEYSRELSGKLARAKRQQAQWDFAKVGRLSTGFADCWSIRRAILGKS
jgi:hypothetical protein